MKNLKLMHIGVLQPKEYFYKYYPNNFKFKEVLWGIEPSKFEKQVPFKNRNL